MDYDFSCLNDKEFELLAVDILREHLSTWIERFKPGKDGGVDGRYFETDDEVVIQCKHWSQSGISKLLGHLEKEESRKVHTIKPKKYIFVTSLPLSKKNKSRIKEIFSPFIHNDSDIYGKEDLNDLIHMFPKIEKKHFKLWISSSHVLSLILNSGIFGRSEDKLSEIREQNKLYVYTKNHSKAREMLEENHSVIISGEPGIGKTFLASQLAAEYAANEFEFVVISGSIEEAESVMEPSKKQLFFFDDFLGRNYLTAINFNNDSKIVNFIKRVKRAANTRFLLTSRTSVFNQGKRLT